MPHGHRRIYVFTSGRRSPATLELSHRILLIEDDADAREATTCGFKLEGAEVTSAGDGGEALYALRNEPRPCVIVLDLPDMDGREFRRRQLLWPRMSSIPVIVLSGHPDLKVATWAMAARAVFAKPVEFGQLLRAVDEYCADADAEAGALRRRLMRTHAWASASARRH